MLTDIDMIIAENRFSFHSSPHEQCAYVSCGQSTEVAICDIRYTHMKDALGYGWWAYQGNLYAERYGKENAKGKPNYRYQVEIFIQKEEIRINRLQRRDRQIAVHGHAEY